MITRQSLRYEQDLNGQQQTKFCVVCGKELTGRQKKLCSDRECHKVITKTHVRKCYLNNIEKRKEYRRKYRLANKERLKERAREYRLKNKGKIKKQVRDWYLNNREKRQEYMRKYIRKYYQNNIEKCKDYARKYCQNNSERVKETRRIHYLNNREKILESSRKRYRRGRDLPEDCDLLRPSGLEIIMKRWFQDFNIEFVEQYYINLKELGANYTKVDFFVEPNICFYSDGGYYHKLEGRSETDTRINNALEAGGYIVIRLSELDILAGIRPIEILELIQ